MKKSLLLLKDIPVVFFGLILWFILQVIFLPIVNDFAFSMRSGFYIPIFYVFLSFLIGFIVGILGNSRGWFLGLITHLMILMSFVLLYFGDPVLYEFNEQVDYKFIFGLIGLQIPLIIAVLVGGYLGEKIRPTKRNG